MNDNVTVVRELYKAFSEKDETALRELLHPDVEWVQCRGFPGGGHHHGVEEVLEKVFRALRRDWKDWRVEVEEYLDAGKSVVALGYYAGTHTITDRPMKAVFAHVYDVDIGRITRFRQFTDTHELVKAANR